MLVNLLKKCKLTVSVLKPPNTGLTRLGLVQNPLLSLLKSFQFTQSVSFVVDSFINTWQHMYIAWPLDFRKQLATFCSQAHGYLYFYLYICVPIYFPLKSLFHFCFILSCILQYLTKLVRVQILIEYFYAYIIIAVFYIIYTFMYV